MPPQLSDDDASEANSGSEEQAIPMKAGKKSKTKPIMVEKEDAESFMVASDEEDEEEELGEDEYVVEAIRSHLVDEETGELRFQVKWEGYDKESDMSWEPEKNLLETASKILNEYLASVGGREAILEAWEEKKAEAKKGKKRGRQSNGTSQTTNGAKRGKKNSHPASESPPRSAAKATFKPPSGSWEDDVVGIDACEGSNNSVIVYLTWKGGHKTQHPLHAVYKRCPQKMLQFYESHLVFKKSDDN